MDESIEHENGSPLSLDPFFQRETIKLSFGGETSQTYNNNKPPPGREPNVEWSGELEVKENERV